MKKKLFARLASCAAAAVLVLGLGLMATGCSQSSSDDAAEQLKAELSASFDEIKNLDDASLNEMFSAEELAEFEAMGIDFGEFINEFFVDFEYTIGDIEIEGDEAEIPVTMKVKDLNEWMSNVEAAAVDLAMSNPTISEEELMSQIGPLMMEALAKVETVEDLSFTVNATNQNGEWVVDEGALDAEIGEAMAEALGDVE